MNEAYSKMKDLFGKELINSIFPEFGINEALIGISAMLQTICNILVLKGVITKEEYLKWFSDKELTKMANYIKEQAELEGVDNENN